MSAAGYRVGVDIGGTFTDLVLIGADGAIWPLKVPSTAGDYSVAVLDGLSRLVEQAGVQPEEIDEIVHGTTVATNAILEKRGARTALITTVGFRDVLEIRRIRMPQLYNIQWEKPAPLVPRYLRFEVPERIDFRGDVLVPLDESTLNAIVVEIEREAVESVAICLLHSYVNPAHEERIAEILRKRLPGISLSVSSEITRELKEFERTSTTVIDAYVKPVVERYLAALRDRLRSAGIGARLLVMQSNGAVMSVEAARAQPCFIIESGPAAGVIAGQALARRCDAPNLITFDMGGTTAKAALIERGAAGLTDEYEVGAGITTGTRLMKGDGYLLRIPAIDLAEVGAGGGSIAWVDSGGHLQVGPRSAGADPGPACYGRGGTEPTITDANVVLGYIAPEPVGGSTMRIDPERAWNVIAALGEQLQLSALDTAFAVHVIANARMSRPIRAVTVERGLDVRDFTLLAFGGSGPLHAAQLARDLGIRRLLIPPYAGVFSALGLSQAHAGHHLVHTFQRRLDELRPGELRAFIADLEQTMRSRLAELNYPLGALSVLVAADMRYVGQAFNLTVEIAPHDSLATIAERFGEQHERSYGHRADADPLEFVSLRLRAIVDAGHTSWPLSAAASKTDSSGRSRPMLFDRAAGLIDTPLVSRTDLRETRVGPLAIEEPDTTIIVPPGCCARLDAWGNVEIEVGVEQAND
ncbi:MAG TPA: hydantoinase/oxoprolinase family protein [Nitrolancea sp.]